MMNEQEIEQLAQDMVNHSVAQQVADQIVKDAAISFKKSKCTCCGSRNTYRFKQVEGIWKCKNCASFFGEDYKFVFPTWARAPRAHLRRFFCLRFNIQGVI